MVSSPRRLLALLWLLLIPVGGVIGGFFAYRGEPVRSIDPSAQSPLTGIVAGAVVGAIAACVMLAIGWRNARRRRSALALHPHAVLVEADDAEATGSALSIIRNGAAPTGHAYSVAFTPDGMHVYQGHDLSPVALVEWSEVTAVREEQIQVSSQSRAALVVEVRTATGTVAVPFVVSVSNGFQSPSGQVEKAASAVAAVRRSSANQELSRTLRSMSPAAPVHGFATPVRRDLVPGIPSTRWLSWARVPPFLGGAVAVVVIGVQVLPGTGLPRGAMVPLALCVGATMLVTLLCYLLANRAMKRERAAGYTLLRLGDPSVDQLDPKTRFVIRRAGEPQLTRAEEIAALRKVSSLS